MSNPPSVNLSLITLDAIYTIVSARADIHTDIQQHTHTHEIKMCTVGQTRKKKKNKKESLVLHCSRSKRVQMIEYF